MLLSRFVFLIIALASASSLIPGAGAPAPAANQDSFRMDSLAAAYRRSVASLTSPEFERRKAARRTLQQHGYSRMVYDLLTQDGPRAALSYLRMKAQIEFHLSHRTLYVYATVPKNIQPEWIRRLPGTSGAPSGPVPIALIDDWSFPTDPWNTSQ